jgi:hypothetical protein
MRQIYVIDSVKSLRSIPKDAAADVLLISIDAAEISGEIKSRNLKGWNIVLLDIEKFVVGANIQVRKFYGNTLNSYIQQKYLNSVNKNPNLFFLDFTETSPFKGKITNSLYFLALFRSVLAKAQYEKVNIVISDKTLSGIMTGRKSRWSRSTPAKYAYWLQACRFLISTLVTKALMITLQIKKAQKNLDYRVFTIFPYWWLRPQTEKAQDRFFPGLNQLFDTQSIGYLGWLEINPQQLIKNRKSVKNTIQNQRIELLNSYIRIADLLDLFSLRKYLTLRTLLSSRRSESHMVFLDFDIRKLLDDEISRSIGSGDFARSRVIFKSTSRYLSSRMVKGIIFRFENQPIDRAIIQASVGKTRSIGYWHSALAMCENYLSLWNLEGISKLTAAAGGHSLTMPDKMLYANEICKLALIREGLSESEIYDCGPTRHLEVLRAVKELNLIKKQDPSHDMRYSRSKSVVISFSADPIASKLMLKTVLKVSAILHDFKVNVKTHPAWQFTEADLQAFCSKYGFAEPTLIDPKEDFYFKLANSGLLISSGTQLAFEAILLGVAPIVFESNSVFTPTNFSSFKDSCFLATNLNELEEAITEVISRGKEFERKRDTWESFSNNLFGDLTQDLGYKLFTKALENITDSSS